MSEMFSPSLPNEYYNAATGRTYYLNPYSGQYITNKTYARRLQRGFARGLTRTAARRNIRAEPGYSESRERAARAQERGNLSPYQVFLGGFERRYGFSYREWRRWYRLYVREINQRAWPTASSPRMQSDENGRKDPRLFPQDITYVKNLYDQGLRPSSASSPATWQEWVEINLAARLDVMIEKQDNNNPDPAKQRWNSRDEIWTRPGVIDYAQEILESDYIGLTASVGPPREWWFYH